MADRCAVQDIIINVLININVNYISQIKCWFKTYTSKPLYVNYINHKSIKNKLITVLKMYSTNPLLII